MALLALVQHRIQFSSLGSWLTTWVLFIQIIFQSLCEGVIVTDFFQFMRTPCQAEWWKARKATGKWKQFVALCNSRAAFFGPMDVEGRGKGEGEDDSSSDVVVVGMIDLIV